MTKLNDRGSSSSFNLGNQPDNSPEGLFQRMADLEQKVGGLTKICKL